MNTMNASAQELAFAPISTVAETVRKKELSPVELVRASLARIDALDSKLNSFYTLFRDDVMAAARAAEAEIAHGQYRGPLHGIPIGIKDIYECGPTTCGSKSLKDYVAAEDCTAVRKLKQSGALVVGKNATYEFAYGFPTTKSYFKPARNPWNLVCDPGGSSSGSGSSVSAGLVYASMGSCTGGSIRWPAQCCGIVGLKATYGRVSRVGVYPLAWSLDHTGPLARTVKDAALMLQGCAGYDPADPASANVPVPDFSARLGQPIKGMRIGLMRSVYEDNCDPKILGPFNAALGEFEKLGARIVDVPSITLTQMQAIEWPGLFAAYGLLISGACYLMAQRARAQVRDELLGALASDVDVLMLPTVGFPVSPVLDDSPGLSIVAEDFSVYTAIFNFTGFPAIQVPCGFDSDGLPVGLQIAGRPFDEATICQVAHAYEQATPWHDKHPTL
jgi:aspartyl-tRNA(Asn)/glutamyl-tRNA(Gln) amidotransferase subunit A